MWYILNIIQMRCPIKHMPSGNIRLRSIDSKQDSYIPSPPGVGANELME
jgi:hypothetical protein